MGLVYLNLSPLQICLEYRYIEELEQICSIAVSTQRNKILRDLSLALVSRIFAWKSIHTPIQAPQIFPFPSPDFLTLGRGNRLMVSR
jgi:hypothetical protein